MQQINAALQAELDKGLTEPRVLLDLFEFYESDYVPGAGGFDPAEAVQSFAAQEITWSGIVYRRSVISRGDISRNMGEKTNSVTIVFSNIDRYVATWAENQQIEGLLCVIRCVSPDVEDDSLVLFVGRCDKPSDIDKTQFSLSVRQDFGNINVTVPPRKFTAEDPDGRLPSDPLFKGINFHIVFGTNTFPVVGPARNLFARLIGQRDTTQGFKQWSSVDGTPYGRVIPELFGRCQMEFIPFAWADKGEFVTYLIAAWNGRGLAMENIKTRTEGFSDPFNLPGPIPAVVHLGDPGGTGTNTGNTNQADLGGGGMFSDLGYIEGASTGSAPDATDDPPVVTYLGFGRLVPLPDDSGDYVLEDWTDNPVHITRFILTEPDFVNINAGFMEDAVNYLTALHCDTPLIDETNDELIVVHQDDIDDAGVNFNRYHSTGLISARSQLYNRLGDDSIIPGNVDGPYEPYDPTEPVPPYIPGATPTFIKQRLLRKRYTANFPITEEIRAVDLLYKILLPVFKGFLRVNKRGKYEIRSEVSADSTRIRSSTAVAVTSIPVLNVTPWKSGPDLLAGRIRLGQLSSTDSEVRAVSSADYSTSGNSISLAASATGGVTATASGAALSGGSTSSQATGTVTIAGTPGAGDTVEIEIDGISVTYTLDADDTTSTVALMMRDWINATPRLQPYILASWDSGSPTVVTIKCLHGALNLASPLLKAHSGPVADPSSAPTVAAAAAGALTAGGYSLAYANVANGGLTALTPIANVTLAVNEKINVSGLPAFPAGVTERQFFLSEETGSTNLRYVTTRTNVSDFSINSLPEPGSALPPSSNTTADELIRGAMSFATNSQDIFPPWPVSTLIVLNDIYLPTVLNGHKYQATSITTGITAATEPTWPTTAGATVVDGGVTWTEIGSTVLAQAGLSRANIIKDSYRFPLGSTQSSVNQIKGNFRDAKADFALTPFKVNDKAHQLQVKKIFPMEVDLSAVDNFHQVSRLANGLLSKFRDGDWFNTLATGPQGLVLEEGDPIFASDDAGGHVNVTTRIEELRIKPNHEVVVSLARKYSTNMFSDDVGSHQITIPSTLHLSRPRSISDLLVSQDGTGNWLISFAGNPRPIEQPETYSVEIWPNTDRDDPDDIIRTLPVTRATTHIGLLSSNASGSGLQIGDNYILTPHADGNNLYSPFEAADGSALAISIEPITKTYQKCDFTIQWIDADRELTTATFADNLVIARVGLQPLASSDDMGDIDWSLCPIMVEWAAGTKTRMIKETYKSFGVAIVDQVTRDNIDPGFRALGFERQGPRHSFQLSGTEYRAYTNPIPAAGRQPDAIVSAPSTGFPFPLRVVMEVSGLGTTMGILNLVIGGDFLSSIYSVRDQEEDGGTISTLHGRVYQDSRFSQVQNGFPVDFEVPEP